MSAFRHQAHLEAPIEDIWRLVATPSHYPEWWPRVIEVRGERFEEGDEWAQVTKERQGPRRVELHDGAPRRPARGPDELRADRRIRRVDTTPAQGGTFVELEMGMQPKRVGDRLFDVALGKSYFRRWSKESLDGLVEAASAKHERS